MKKKRVFTYYLATIEDNLVDSIQILRQNKDAIDRLEILAKHRV
jgi:hypothetical protein